MEDITNQKKALRKEVLNIRKNLTCEEVEIKSRDIVNRIIESDVYKQAECIYAYMPLNKEVDVTMLIEDAWQKGKRVAVPKVHGKDMVFYYIESFDELAEGSFGIREPREGLRVAAEEEALLIIPGVVFDVKGHRIGYGGGFYDRYREKHNRHFALAPAYDFQVKEHIVSEEHDIVVDMLIFDKQTERE